MNILDVLERIKLYVENNLNTEIREMNGMFIDNPLEENIKLYPGIYNPNNLHEYPAIVIAPDSIEPDERFTTYRVSLVIALKADDIQVLSDKGLKYVDCVVNAMLRQERIDEDFIITRIEGIDYAIGTDMFFSEILISIEGDNKYYG